MNAHPGDLPGASAARDDAIARGQRAGWVQAVAAWRLDRLRAVGYTGHPVTEASVEEATEATVQALQAVPAWVLDALSDAWRRRGP